MGSSHICTFTNIVYLILTFCIHVGRTNIFRTSLMRWIRKIHNNDLDQVIVIIWKTILEEYPMFEGNSAREKIMVCFGLKTNKDKLKSKREIILQKYLPEKERRLITLWVLYIPCYNWYISRCCGDSSLPRRSYH